MVGPDLDSLPGRDSTGSGVVFVSQSTSISVGVSMAVRLTYGVMSGRSFLIGSDARRR